MAITVLIFIASFLILVRSSSYLVIGLTRIARLLGVSEFLVAFIMMSAATSMSELFIGFSSAGQNAPLLSFGNVLGSNFINIVLVLGIVSVLINGFEIKSKIQRKKFRLIFGLAVLPLLLIADGRLSRIDGVILLFAFFLYIFKLLEEKSYFTEIFNHVKFEKGVVGKFLKEIGLTVLGLILLVASSAFVVYFSKNIAEILSIKIFVFGLIFVSLGTTLPELIFGLKAAELKHPDLAVGNALGSIAFNSTFILGIVSLISPINFAWNSNLVIVSAFLIFSLILFNIFVYTKGGLSRKEGFFLLFIYLLFIIIKLII